MLEAQGFRPIFSDEMSEGSSEIIDLRDFNKWVKRTRGFPHDPKTVKSATQQLIEKGVLTNAQRYTNYLWKWRLEPIRVLMPPPFRPPQKKSTPQLEIPKLDPSNAESVENEDITTTTVDFSEQTTSLNETAQDEDLEQKLEACRIAGIYYHPKDAKFMCDFSFLKVLKAITYFLLNRETVRTPEGWFRRCLENKWAEQEEERQPYRNAWSPQNLFEAIRYCNEMIKISSST